ncbi:MAG TPA: D-cysteine desulfhydrase family protein [Acidimicrobiales bacterium]|nr:D-cysteine desulfhydrase family protein [Acidimicrobiales bacterium]
MATDTRQTVPVILGTWPTPLEPAPRLAQAIGLGAEDLWIKRDDLTGLGGGGNKVRKLEWICGEAMAQGADTLVTCGARQSNHARLTAAAGARLGLKVVLVLAGTKGGSDNGNVALNGLCGATVAWAGDVAHEALESVASSIMEVLRDRGARPVCIPYGGSNALGARGYVEGGREILAQMPRLTTVVTAVGSGGTMAGLVHALGARRVLGVDTGALVHPGEAVADLLASLASLAGLPSAPEELRLRVDHVGAGYGELTDTVMSALLVAARTEGLILDPIYTGRALAGLVSAVNDGQIRPGEPTVLLHTGGLPGLFGHPVTISRAAEKVTEFRFT